MPLGTLSRDGPGRRGRLHCGRAALRSHVPQVRPAARTPGFPRPPLGPPVPVPHLDARRRGGAAKALSRRRRRGHRRDPLRGVLRRVGAPRATGPPSRRDVRAHGGRAQVPGHRPVGRPRRPACPAERHSSPPARRRSWVTARDVALPWPARCGSPSSGQASSAGDTSGSSAGCRLGWTASAVAPSGVMAQPSGKAAGFVPAAPGAGRPSLREPARRPLRPQ